ncbi:hypothetical protein THAOC_08846, partial [Thalassiosira oceanica]
AEEFYWTWHALRNSISIGARCHHTPRAMHQHRGAMSPHPSGHERTAADDPDNPTAPPAPNIPVITPALPHGLLAPTSTTTGLIQYDPFRPVVHLPRKLDRALKAAAEPPLTHQLAGLAKSSQEAVQEARTAQTSLKTTTEGAVDVNEALAATLAAARTTLQNNLEVLDGSTARLKDATNKAKKKSDAVHTLMQRLDTWTTRSVQVMEDIDVRHALLDKKHGDLESLHATVLTKLAKASSLLDNQGTKLNQATELHKTAVAGADVLAKEMNEVREKVTNTKRDATTAIKQEKSRALQSMQAAPTTIDKTFKSTLERIQSAGDDRTDIDVRLESLVSQRLDATLVHNDVQAKLETLVSVKLDESLARIRTTEGDRAAIDEKMESLTADMQAKLEVLASEKLGDARLNTLLEEKLDARVPQSPIAQPTRASGDEQWNGGFGDMSTIRSTPEESAPSSQRATTPRRALASGNAPGGAPPPGGNGPPGDDRNDNDDRASNSDTSTLSRDRSTRDFMRRLYKECRLGDDHDHSGRSSRGPLRVRVATDDDGFDTLPRRRIDQGVLQTTFQDLAPSKNQREALRTSTTHFKGDRGLHSTPFQWRDFRSIPQEIIHEQSRQLTGMWDTWTNKRHGLSGPRVHDALAATDFPTLEAESDEAALQWYDRLVTCVSRSGCTTPLSPVPTVMKERRLGEEVGATYDGVYTRPHRPPCRWYWGGSVSVGTLGRAAPPVDGIGVAPSRSLGPSPVDRVMPGRDGMTLGRATSLVDGPSYLRMIADGQAKVTNLGHTSWALYRRSRHIFWTTGSVGEGVGSARDEGASAADSVTGIGSTTDEEAAGAPQ